MHRGKSVLEPESLALVAVLRGANNNSKKKKKATELQGFRVLITPILAFFFSPFSSLFFPS